MRPGDLVQSRKDIVILQSRLGSPHPIPQWPVPRGSVGMVLAYDKTVSGNWVRWSACGHVGWSLVHFLEVVL